MKNELEIYIADTLGIYVGGNGIPVRDVALALGICTSAVYQHRSREGACPTAAQLILYTRLLPDEFKHAIDRPAGFTGAYRPEVVEGCLFKATLHGIHYASDALLSMTAAAEDGIIDPGERRSVPVHILSATSYLNALAAGYGAAQ